MIFQGLVVSAVLCGLLACAGHGNYFRHRWWNFFERGMSYMDQGLYDQALVDLDEALAQRSIDQRMAMTYGMHFIDYFPHREKGVVLYHLGQMDKAEEELDLSISQYPSAKARYFLDLVRKARITASGQGLEPPVVVLDDDRKIIWTRSDPVRISGTVRDPAYVSRIDIQEEQVFQEGAQNEITFAKDLNLDQGQHSVMISAINLAGTENRRKVTIHVDRQGPLVILDAPYQEPQGLRIQGTAMDRAGVVSLFVDGVSMPIRRKKNTNFSFILAPETSVLIMDIHDRLGNQTHVELPVKQFAALQQHPCLLAANSNWPGGGAVQKDRKAPEIRIRDWKDRQVVFLDNIYLDGMVRDGGGIGSLTINGREILESSGVLVAFNRFIPLVEGENRIRVEAKDYSGNKAVRNILIERRIPEALQLKQRLALTVFPFDHSDTVSPLALSLQDHVIGALVRENRFRVVERDFLEQIMGELNIGQTTLVDPQTRLTIGKLTAAQIMLAGRMVENSDGFEIVSRVVDTESAEILATMDVYTDKKDNDALRQMAWGLASKLHREFPLTGGSILTCEGRTITTDLGKDEIKPFRRLLVYRTPRVPPESQSKTGVDYQVVGRARVTGVDQETSKAELDEDLILTSDEEGRVIAQ